MFNATDLIKQWNLINGEKKEVTKFFENSNTKAFIYTLMEEENLNTQNLAYLKTRGKTGGGTWMHPYLFIKFAMWLNPRFELTVIKFVYDQLINYRHQAGARFTMLTSSVSRFNNVDYPQMAKGLNWIVFGKHEKEIRNTATEEQLQEMAEVQKNLSFAIDMGYINSFEDLMEQMRIMWRNKHLKV